MHIIDTRCETIRYLHYKTILFTIPNVERITVANKRNWNCHRHIIQVIVLPREEQLAADEDVEYDEDGGNDDDEGGDDDDEEKKDVDAG